MVDKSGKIANLGGVNNEIVVDTEQVTATDTHCLILFFPQVSDLEEGGRGGKGGEPRVLIIDPFSNPFRTTHLFPIPFAESLHQYTQSPFHLPQSVQEQTVPSRE